MKSVESLQLFRDVYELLESGGQLVVATISLSGTHIYMEAGTAVLKDNRAIKEAWYFINRVLNKIPEQTAILIAINLNPVHDMIASVHLSGLQELLSLTHFSGFEIDLLYYITVDCYFEPFGFIENCALLVNRKQKILGS